MEKFKLQRVGCTYYKSESFTTLDPADQQKAKEVIDYMLVNAHLLLPEGQTTVWLYPTFFENDRLILSKGKINALLMEYHSTRTEEEVPTSDAVVSNPSAINTTDYSLNSSMDAVIDQAVNSMNEAFHTYLIQYRRLIELNIQALDKPSDDWANSLSPFYKILFCNSEKLVLLTKEVTLSHENMTFNFGSFLVELWNGDLRVRPWILGNNTAITSVYHPHVNSSSSLCIGEFGERYARAMKNGDIATILWIVENILCSYNDRSPYRALHRYLKNKDKNLHHVTSRSDFPLTSLLECTINGTSFKAGDTIKRVYTTGKNDVPDFSHEDVTPVLIEAINLRSDSLKLTYNDGDGGGYIVVSRENLLECDDNNNFMHVQVVAVGGEQ